MNQPLARLQGRALSAVPDGTRTRHERDYTDKKLLKEHPVQQMNLGRYSAIQPTCLFHGDRKQLSIIGILLLFTS